MALKFNLRETKEENMTTSTNSYFEPYNGLPFSILDLKKTVKPRYGSLVATYIKGSQNSVKTVSIEVLEKNLYPLFQGKLARKFEEDPFFMTCPVMLSPMLFPVQLHPLDGDGHSNQKDSARHIIDYLTLKNFFKDYDQYVDVDIYDHYPGDVGYDEDVVPTYHTEHVLQHKADPKGKQTINCAFCRKEVSRQDVTIADDLFAQIVLRIDDMVNEEKVKSEELKTLQGHLREFRTFFYEERTRELAEKLKSKKITPNQFVKLKDELFQKYFKRKETVSDGQTIKNEKKRMD